MVSPVEKVIQKKRNEFTTLPIYRFPKDLSAHAVVLTFKTYEFRAEANAASKIDSCIILPIPKNIQDNYNMNLKQDSLGIFGAAATEMVALGKNNNNLTSDMENAGKKFSGNIYDTLRSIGSTDKSDFLSASRYLQRAAIGSISSTMEAGIDIATGTLLNPQLALTFDGISLKTFTFNWALSPTSDDEHRTLANIIKRIKKNILPTFQSPLNSISGDSSFARGLLKYPSLVDIYFVGLDQDYFLYYKTAMVNQFSTDYSPGGNSFFRGANGAKPVVSDISLSFTEVEIHTSHDYADGDI